LINSWTLTLGLSAGIEKVISIGAKGSYGEKTKQQFEHESRRTVSRRIKTDYTYFTDVMDLKLTPAFIRNVMDRLNKLNVGNDPEWGDFVHNFGTHYVHAITYGSTDFAETLYSMDAETFAWEKSYSLETEAKGALEGIEFGAKAGEKHEWGGKLGKKVSTEDVTHVIIGGPGQPAAIFLDLRPSWELFSPVFFPPDFTKDASPDRAVAPFIWRKLRASFEEYVRNTIQVGQPLDPSCDVSYKPRILKVTLPEFKIWTPNQSPCMYGAINLMGTNQVTPDTPPVLQLYQRNWNVSSPDSQRISNGSDLPGIGDVSLACACSPADFEAGASYVLTFHLVNWDPVLTPEIRNNLRYGFRDGDQVFEWHGDNGWGHKIRIKVEEV
jgi:hypothetical protein